MEPKNIVRKEKELIKENYTFRDSTAADKSTDLHWWENQVNVLKGNEYSVMNCFMVQ